MARQGAHLRIERLVLEYQDALESGVPRRTSLQSWT